MTPYQLFRLSMRQLGILLIESAAAFLVAHTTMPARALPFDRTLPPHNDRSQLTPRLSVTPAPTPTYAVTNTDAINGVPVDQFIVISGSAAQHIREIYENGQALGRNPNAFSEVGDSTIVWPRLMGVFNNPKSFTLGAFDYLQPTIDYYAGSFARSSPAARKSLHAWSVMTEVWPDRGACLSTETMLDCELRLNNPAIVIIRLGVNDVGAPKLFDDDYRKIVAYFIANGVIPVIGTKPDRFEGKQNTINILLRKIAADYNVPLWDYDRVAATLPGRGLWIDNVHMGPSTHDYTTFLAFASGNAMHDLTALMMLDAIRKELAQPRLYGRHYLQDE